MLLSLSCEAYLVYPTVFKKIAKQEKTGLMNQFYQSFFLFFVFGFCSQSLFGQLYPVSNTLVIQPPGSIYLTDYTQVGSQKMTLNLMLKDFSVTSHDVALNIKIDGPGVRLQTSGNFIPAPITLFPGMNSFEGSEIADYFNPINMDVQGIDQTSLLQSNQLPEGMYTFCVEVTDYQRRDVKLSTQHCSALTLQRNYPPLAVFPTCGTVVPASGPSNVLFQWQARHNLSVQAEYLLTVVAVNGDMSPNDAMIASQTPILDKAPVFTNSFTYTPDLVPLEMGKTYAYRVDVHDPMMEVTFENGGIGEVCHFTYGFEEGGIELTGPDDQSIIKMTEQPFLKWNGPDKVQTGLEIYYNIRIAEVGEAQDPEQAIEQNSPIILRKTDVVPQLNNWNVLITETLPTEKQFAWQVEAIAVAPDGSGNEQKIAESEIWSFRRAPNVPDFWAANETVKVEVITTNGTNPDNLSGKGLIKIDPDQDPVEVEFSNLRVSLRPSSNVLREGVIDFKLDKEIEVPLSWNEEVSDNGDASFVANHIVLDKDHFKLRGQVEWQYPIDKQDESTIVKSEPVLVQYDNYLLRTEASGLPFQEFTIDLTDPWGFRINLKKSSAFFIYDQELTTKMDGEVLVPKSVKSESKTRVRFSFEDTDNPYLYSNENLKGANSLKPVDQLGLTVEPQSVVFDFSEEESVGYLSEEKEWKGISIMKYKCTVRKDFDGSKNFVLEGDMVFEMTQDEESAVIAWIDGQGLDLTADKSWDLGSGPKAEVYTFKDEIINYLFQVEDNQLVDSCGITGFIKIPVLDDDELFLYNLPFTSYGLGKATLDMNGKPEDQQREFMLNEGDPNQEITIRIKSAVFSGTDHIDMTIDFEWFGLYAYLENLSGFKIWGDESVGFNEKNGKIYLSEQENSFLPGSQTYAYIIESIRAINDGGNFGFITEGGVTINGHVQSMAGDKFSLSIPSRKSVKTPGGDFPALPYDGDHAWNDYLDGGVSYENGTYTCAFKMDVGILKTESIAMYKPGDETWGDVFFAYAFAKFGFRGMMELLTDFMSVEVFVQFLLGKQYPGTEDEFTYWFAEAGLGAIERGENWYETQFDKVGKSLPMLAEGEDANASNGSNDNYIFSIIAEIDRLSGELKPFLKDLCLEENRDFYRNWRGSRVYPRLDAMEGFANSALEKLKDGNYYMGLEEDFKGVQTNVQEIRENLKGNWMNYRKSFCLQGPNNSIESNLEKLAKVDKFSKLILKEPPQHYFDALKEKFKSDGEKDTKKPPLKDRLKQGAKEKYAAMKERLSKLREKSDNKVSKRERIKTGITKTYDAAKQKVGEAGQKVGETVDNKKQELKANIEEGKLASNKKGMDKLSQTFGLGYPIPPALWITGIQGRLYYHMNRDLSTGTMKGVNEADRAIATANEDLTANKNAEIEELSALATQSCNDPGYSSSFPNPFQEMQMPYFPASQSFNYQPDKSTVFGGMLMANFIDMPTQGTLADGYGSLEISTSGLRAETELNLGNYQIPMTVQGSFLNAYLSAYLQYDSETISLGGDMLFKTNPLFCGGGDGSIGLTLGTDFYEFSEPNENGLKEMSFKASDKNELKIRLGSYDRPVWFLPGCAGVTGMAYLDFLVKNNESYLEGGLGVRFFAGLQTPEKTSLADFVTIDAYAGANLDLLLSARIQFQPNFKVERIGFDIEAWMGACISGEVIDIGDYAGNVAEETFDSIGSFFSGDFEEAADWDAEKNHITFFEEFGTTVFLKGEVYTKDDAGKEWAAKGSAGISKTVMGKEFTADLEFDIDF